MLVPGGFGMLCEINLASKEQVRGWDYLVRGVRDY